MTNGIAAHHELALSYQGLTIRVRSARLSHLLWLEEFLLPHFERSDRVDQARVVELIEDDEAYRRMHSEARAGSEKIDCFALDSSVVRLPWWRDSSGADVAFDEAYRTFYRVSTDRSQVTVVTGRENASIRTPLMRVVRELAMNHCHGLGALFLHASAVVGEVGGRARGLIVTGRKAAGKSTLLIYLLSSRRVRYLANDRVLVTQTAQASEMRGLPSVVTIRPRTFQLFPDFEERFHDSSFRQQLTIAEAAQRPAPARPWGDGRFGMTPAQLCRLVRAEQAVAAVPAAIFFPRITEQPGGVELRQMAVAEAADCLAPSLLGAGTWKKSSDLFTTADHGAPGPDEPTLRRLCQSLAERVPCFECALGLQAYETPAGHDEILAQLDGANSRPRA